MVSLDCKVDKLRLWPFLNLHIEEWHWTTFRFALLTVKIVTNWTSPSSAQTEYLSIFFFYFNKTTFDSEKEMPSLILFTLMKAGSSATGSFVGSIIGIASLKYLVWQHDPMVYWGLRVLKWNGWIKEEKVLQLQSTISLSLLTFP